MPSFYQRGSHFEQSSNQNQTNQNQLSAPNSLISINKPKSFKRIGAKPVIAPFFKEFQLSAPPHTQQTKHNKQNKNQDNLGYPSTKKLLFKENPDRKLKRIGKKVWITAYKQQLIEQENNGGQIAEKKLYDTPSLLQKKYGKMPSITSNSNDPSILEISQQENHHQFNEFHEELVESTSKCNTPSVMKQGDNIFNYQFIVQDSLTPARKKQSTLKKQESFAKAMEISDEQAEEDILEDNMPKILEQYEKKIDQYMQQNYIRRPSVKNSKSKRNSRRKSKVNKNQLGKIQQESGYCEQRKGSIKKSVLKKPLPSPYPFNQKVGLTNSLPVKSQSLHTSINQLANLDHQNSTNSIILHSPCLVPPPKMKENSQTQLYSQGKSMSQHHKNKTFKKVDQKDMSASVAKLQKQKKLQINRYILDAKKQIKNNSPYR